MLFDSPCHCTNLRRAAQHLTRIYDEALASCGIKITQYSLLRNVKKLEGPNLMELSKAMGLDRSTLGRNTRVLQRQGLVELSDGEDERTTVVRLTDKGLTTLTKAIRKWQGAQTKVNEALGNDGDETLKVMLAGLTSVDA